MVLRRMTRGGFWAIIASCITTSELRPKDSERVYEHRLMALLGRTEKLDQFRLHFGQCTKILRIMMDSIGLDVFDELYLTEADLRFLASTIIGEGETEFTRAVTDPERMRDRAKDGNFSSLFELSIPMGFIDPIQFTPEAQ